MNLDQEWDVIVVGGGITGAGIFRQAVHEGYKTLLVEQRDFAWGTSSRSSKLVHGGLRYLQEGRVDLVRDCVAERQALMAEAPGLVEPLPFLVPDYKRHYPPPWLLRAGLAVYDALAMNWQHEWLDRERVLMGAPHINRDGLTGGGRFLDAQVDDARLVLRVLLEGEAEGGKLLNYTTAQLPHREGEFTHLKLKDRDGGRSEVRARVVFNATGAWADEFSERRPGRLRPLRGSHLVFESWRLPLPCAISFNHPQDGRPGFLIPWEGASFVGTTDVDHEAELSLEPAISQSEFDYLLSGLQYALPHLQIGRDDVIGSWAGVRPVISHGKHVDPSKEKRDHGLWDENGVVTMTGGKLTTFRLMALEAIEKARHYLWEPRKQGCFSFATPAELPREVKQRRRLQGRYGERARDVLEVAGTEGLAQIRSSHTQWAELVWGARTEHVVHLDDLLLRRTRLGFVLPGGGREHLSRIGELCRTELGWDQERWDGEVERYLKLWDKGYGVATGLS